jgi:hypothetical protein
MASPDPRAVRQLRHDVDDVYELLDATTRSVDTIASTQHQHSSQLEEIQQALDLQNGRLDLQNGRLDLQNGRLDRIEDTQRQILDLLRSHPDDTTAR